MRRVEGERARLQLVDGGAVEGAAVLLAVALLLEGAGVRGRHDHDALAQAQRRLHRVGQASRIRVRVLRVEGSAVLIRVAHDEPVHDDLDGVPLVLVERGRLIEVEQLAVHADAHEALAPGCLEDAVAFRLAVLDERAQHEEAGAVRQRQDAVHDLLHAHARDLAAALGAVRVADAREQQAEVVVDLRHRADGGARVAAGALLVDGDGRREAIDLVDVRLLHLAQELAGVRGEALHVAALALRVDGVEGEAGLAAAGQAGDDDQPVAGQLDGDVLEVVLAGAANDEQILGHVRQCTAGGRHSNRRSRLTFSGAATACRCA